MMRIRSFEPGTDDAEWDRLCDSSLNGATIHTRRFLAYHGDRFIDRSIMLLNDNVLVGVLPAAIDPQHELAIVSHPGATFGGVVHSGYLRGAKMRESLDLILDFYRRHGYEYFTYKAIPRFYHQQPCEDDEYFLRFMGATVLTSSLNCVLTLGSASRLSSRKRRNLKKARDLHLSFDEFHRLAEFHSVLCDNLSRRHRRTPVHSLPELVQLSAIMGENLKLCLATLDGQIVAGVVIFRSPRVWHAQYIAGTQQGFGLGAVDACLAHCLDAARLGGCEHFSFGISDDPETGKLNDTLYDFKAEFGGGGVVQCSWGVRL